VRKTVILAVVVLSIYAVSLHAQSATPSSDAGQTSGKSAELTTLQGCLSYSHDRYTLTEEDGTTHQLVGALGKLGHQVGRQVEVTGKPGLRTVDNTLVGGASSATEQQVFEVKGVKRLADACK
jgi:hypothetical protein